MVESFGGLAGRKEEASRLCEVGPIPIPREPGSGPQVSRVPPSHQASVAAPKLPGTPASENDSALGLTEWGDYLGDAEPTEKLRTPAVADIQLMTILEQHPATPIPTIAQLLDSVEANQARAVDAQVAVSR